jgi:hypothetical protein
MRDFPAYKWAPVGIVAFKPYCNLIVLF